MNNKKKKILVTGGAGYIGSITVQVLKKEGFEPIIFDSLETGHKESVAQEKFYQGDLVKDVNLLDEVFKKEKPEAVIHFAAMSLAGESVINPQKYFTNNLVGVLNLLKVMLENKVLKIVFSSTAAVYGEPKKVPIDEDDDKNPTSPYGESKLMIEKILTRYGQAYGLNSIALRYFNACGAFLDGSLGEDHSPESHLIPAAMRAALNQKHFKLFGNDYPTPDGTCIRDYIHVLDLAQAHILALKNFQKGFQFYNVGTNHGFSVLEILKTIKKVSGIDFGIDIIERRAGDPARLIAKAEKIKKELGWKAKYSDLETIIKSAWKWHSRHLSGYKKIST
ncbi:MAG: UDP-glucose 4-epimerase GalE [Patescibacteria group bacterium]|nr:UDP-glucose 4-epimerase GalE [Patescibacteria group bacterium]